MLTIAQIKSLMEHGVGATPDSRHNLYHTLNRAGRYLTDYHVWSWRLVGPVSLPTIAGERLISLPSDFGKLMRVTCPTAGAGAVTQAGLAEVLEMHAGTAPVIDGRWYFHAPPFFTADDDGHDIRTAILYPTPSADGNPALHLTYYRRWREIAADGSDDSTTPAIPAEFEQALIMLCRGFAIDLQDQADSIELARATAELSRLMAQDGANQLEHGRMHGGANDRLRRRATDIRISTINVN